MITPVRLRYPNAEHQNGKAPRAAKSQRKAATTKGPTKWITPYDSQAGISRTGWVKRVRISEMFAPYNTDSSVGRRMTLIGGRQSTGVKRDEKNVMTHVKIGSAGKKLKSYGQINR
jgi:hypothetical protein